ncbi:MAG: DUF1353 domain-containing protein [Tepidamorphaceae bacterium]
MARRERGQRLARDHGAAQPFDLSVPWWLQWALSPHNRVWLPAAAVHDYMLETGCDAFFAAGEFRRAVQARIDRATADRIKQLIARGWPERLAGAWCWITRDRRVWPASIGVLIWTVLKLPSVT